MSQSRKCTAIKAVLALALLCCAALAPAAQVVGTVMHLSGPLLAKKADGTAKVLAVKSEVEQGDTLVTEKNSYALIKFIDNSEITLRPGSALTVEQFAFDAGKADADGASLALIKGGLRALTGLLGKRNKERFSMKTPAATIGIRGTTFIVEYVPETAAALAASRLAYALASTAALGGAGAAIAPLTLAQAPVPGMPPAPKGGLAPGLYVHVIDGLITLSNGGGAQSFSAGQFGYTPSFVQPPVVVPRNPGIQFAPPPAFSSNAPAGRAAASPKANTVDCEVR
ncbi:FecR family protein [Janthinobacterium fluminis]|uniref:FecR family protein n=1 Tax=Janthinobacterium fluminis TaxID=2987524 RepID=A0ABT5K291_9BURK|nr:FecR family protein [Janthinobacterium fluminis]MDC8759098.1 FecR family protein [Janthinobacterium fluminis]